MIKISYYDGCVMMTPDNMDDNEKLVAVFKDSSLKSVSYYNGQWSVSEDEMRDLNTVLSAIDKNVFIQDNSFTTWLKEWLKGQDLRTPYVIRCGVITSKIYPNGNKIPHEKIEEVCKYFWKPAVRQKKFIDKKWDGYICLYKRWLHEFPTGLLHDVIGVFEQLGLPYKVQMAYETRPPKQFNWIVDDGIVPDPDQIESIQAAIDGVRGILKCPTGFGKTAVLAKRLTAHYGVPTLFVANKKTLLDDAAKEFREGIKGLGPNDVIQIKDGWFGEMKLDPSVTTEDIKPLTAPIIVATIQSLEARLKDERTKPYLLDWLHNVCKFAMVDESQAVGTKIWDEVLDECKAPYRIFLSATPRRTDGATLKLIASSGRILFTTTAEEQIEKGRLCDLDINYVVYDHKLYNDNDSDVNYHEMYRLCITENEDRNIKCVVNPTMEMLDEGRHVLVLVQYIEHGQMLKNMFMEAGLEPDDIRFIWGETPDKVRTSAIQEFRKGQFKVMIGSTIFDAGVNIPVISGVVLAGAGNSDITLIQRIGRGARNCDYEDVLGYLPEFMQKAHGKKKTKVYDVLDTNTKFFYRQSKNRYYNARDEFGADRVHIVGGDKSILRRSKAHNNQLDKQIDQLSAQLAMLDEFAKKE